MLNTQTFNVHCHHLQPRNCRDRSRCSRCLGALSESANIHGNGSGATTRATSQHFRTLKSSQPST